MKRQYQILMVSLGLVFLIFGLTLSQTNLLPNGDIETIEPNFWEKLNGTTECTWAEDTAAAGVLSRRSLKVVKSAATADVVGWKSVNNANLYWNDAGKNGADTYGLKFTAKTEGVNTSPANDDAKIGVWFRFYAGSSLLAEKFVTVDQSTAGTNFTTYEDAVYVSSEPDEVYAELVMGKDATGTVWFDNIDCNTNAGWTMGIFNGDCEIPKGWMSWSTEDGFANFVADTGAHSGDYSVLLKEEDTEGDEMVFYSEPVPAEPEKWYMASVWTKTGEIDTIAGTFQTAGTLEYIEDRIGICYFFHKTPLYTSFDSFDDQFAYIDQRPGQENQDWTKLTVIAKSPEEAAGFSMRARYNSYSMGSVWYDDFSFQEVTLVPTSIEDYGKKGVTIATEYMLQNNYPNPFNPITNIEYYVPKAGNVSLVVYNIMGQKVRTLVEGNHIQGTFHAVWDGCNDAGKLLSSGVYFYQLKGTNAVITKKMTFIK